MTEDIFKAPKSKRSLSKYDFEPYGSPPKRPRTRDDFVAFCNIVLQYTQYEAQRQEDLRAQHNLSPLDSVGSTADSYSSDSTSSSFSSSGHQDTPGPRRAPPGTGAPGEEDSYELITCHCLKPYAGRPMIECSECDTWIHLSCAKIRKSNIPETFVCQQCRDSKFTMRKSNRSRTETKRISV